jgi:uncharacterized protein (DUF58 family)
MNPILMTSDTARIINEIEIHTRRLLSGSMSGDSRSAIKGTGFEFDQIREYQVGDDVRFIDWNASVRMNSLLVKQYIEERSRTVFFALDISASSFWGTKIQKFNVLAYMASVLAIVANYGNDRTGLLLFSDDVIDYMPPARGQSHVRKLMERVWHAKPCKQTKVKKVFEYLARLKKRDSVVFLLTDYIDDHENPYMAFVANMYDMIVIRCLDDHERMLPKAGFITIYDNELEKELTIDLRTVAQERINTFLAQRKIAQERLFKKYHIDYLDVADTDESIGSLVRFFRRRMRY